MKDVSAHIRQASEPGPTFCARCGQPNPPNAQYCSKCQASLR